MNRPKTILVSGNCLDKEIYEYIVELNKYCDELENKIKSLSNAYDDCLFTSHFWEEEYCKYRKALDVLALYLTTTNECPDERDDCRVGGILDIKKCRDCWKEWALNVER